MLKKIIYFCIYGITVSSLHAIDVTDHKQGTILFDDFSVETATSAYRKINQVKQEDSYQYIERNGIRFLELSGQANVTYENIDWKKIRQGGELSFDFIFNFTPESDQRINDKLRNQLLVTITIQNKGSLMIYWVKEGDLVVLFKDNQKKNIAHLRTKLLLSKNEPISFKLTWGNGVLLWIDNKIMKGLRLSEEWKGFAENSKCQANLRIGASENDSVINCFSIANLALISNEPEKQIDSISPSTIDISYIPDELKKYYTPADKNLSYPDYPLEQDSMVKPSSNPLASQRMRLVHIEPHVLKTIEQARQGVRFLKTQGFNALISEHSRYLMRDVESVDNDEFHIFKTQRFNELVRNNRLVAQAAHENGMKFYLHLTYNMIDDELARQHPEWLIKDLVTGEIERNRYKTFAACASNDDFFKVWSQRFKRLMHESNTDGAMVDEVQCYSPKECGCDWCMKKFKQKTGLELPVDRKDWILNISDPVYRQWVIWRKNELLARNMDITSIVKECNPEAVGLVYGANPTDLSVKMFYGGTRFDERHLFAQSIGQECEPPMSKGYGHLSHYYLHSIIYEMKYNQAVARKTGNGYWTLFYGARAGSKHQPGWNVRAWLMALSQGSGIWYLQYYPWLQKPQLAWEKKHQALLPHLLPYTSVTIPVSVSSQTWVPKVEGHPGNLVSFSSTCTAMQDSHIPHRLITEYDLDSGEFLKDTQLLLAMNLTALSTEAIKSISRFVKQGGTVVLSGESSMYNKLGNKRKDFGLSELIGAHYAESVASSKLFVIDKPNDITGDFIGKLKPTYGFVRVKSISPDVKIAGYIVDSDNKQHPAILSRKYGKGRVIYFAGYPDAKYFIGHGYNLNRIEVNKLWQDKRDRKYLALLSKMVHQLVPDLTMQIENLPRRILAEIHKQDTPEIKGYQVHLLNLLDTKLQTGFIDPPPPLRFPSVKDNLPDKNKPIKIKVKSTGIKGVFMITPDFDKIVKIPFEQSDGFTQIELPYFYRYAMLYFVQDGIDVINKLAGDNLVDVIPPCKSIGEYGQEYPPVGKYNPDDAVFFADSENFQGGHLYDRPSVWPMIRRYVVGKSSGEDIVTFNFDLKEIDGPLAIDICAKNNNSSIKAPMSLSLNGTKLTSWKNNFPYNNWAVKRVMLPANILKSGENKLMFENHGQEALLRAPWFGINFIRIRAIHD